MDVTDTAVSAVGPHHIAVGRDHFDLFDTLRIAAALLVVFWHAYPLTGHTAPVVALLGRAGFDYGSLAVGAFFVMSGFLITASWLRSQSPGGYVKNRLVRIWPGLAMVVFLSTFVVGPLVTNLPLRSYLGSHDTLAYWSHKSLLAPWFDRLPGVFADNAYGDGVNGSLWTLPYEVLAYIAVLALGIFGVLRRCHLVAIVAVAFAALHLLVVDTQLIGPHFALGFDLGRVAELGLFFFIGATCFVHLDIVKRRHLLLNATGIATMVGGGILGSQVIASVGLAVTVITVGILPSKAARRLRGYGDPSYGTYIYAFVIQQLLAQHAWVKTPTTMLLVAAPLSLLAGYLSWHCVEHPTIRWAKARSRDRERAQRPDHERSAVDVAHVTRVGVEQDPQLFCVNGRDRR